MRTLPIRPEPHPDESFSSYVDRLAASCNVRLLTLLARTGVIDQDHSAKSSLMAGYGVSLSPQKLRAFSRAARLPEERVSEMLMTSYKGLACDFRNIGDLSDSLAVRIAARSNWAYFVGSHACPSCLKESGGAWKLAWKLPWSFACTRHRNLLIDSCPSCKLRLCSGRRDARCSPASPSRVPVLGACRNTPQPLHRSSNTRPDPCGYSLYQAKAGFLGGEFHRILEAQERIDAVLGGALPAAAGEETAPLAYFLDLRSLTAMILAWGVMEDLGELPEPARAAFARHIKDREDGRPMQGRPSSLSEDERDKSFSKLQTYTPQNAALLAGVVPLAVTMLASPTPQVLAESVSSLVLRIREQNPQRFFSRMRSFNLSARLEDARSRCVKPHQRPAYRLNSSRAKEPAKPSSDALSHDHVPQLLWKEHYEDLFARLLEPGTRKPFARAFCSMALVKTIDKTSWEQAAVELGIPQRTGRATANNVVIRLNRSGEMDLFTLRIGALAEILAETLSVTNYGLRRRALTNFEIGTQDWNELSQIAGVRPGKPGGRRIYASVWLWCYLTDGYYLFSPWFARNNTKSAQTVYWRFRRYELDGLKSVLEARGKQVLAKLAGPQCLA